MPLPNFFVIGAAKTGTSSLYSYLAQHPQIFMSRIKEPEYFFADSRPGSGRGPGDLQHSPPRCTWEQYLALFDCVSSQIAIGESSTSYLRGGEKTAVQIHSVAPNARLIAILRQPADRAYSNYIHLRREGSEPFDSFPEALLEEEVRRAQGWAPIWSYRHDGFYHDNLEAFYRHFGADRIKVFLYDDWKDPASMMKDAFVHLGVDSSFAPKLTLQHNRGGLHRHPWLGREPPRRIRRVLRPFIPRRFRDWMWMILEEMRRRDLDAPPPLDPGLRRKLTEEYRNDIIKTATLIGRDLSAWLN